MSDNTITIVGNVTRDPELRYTASGRGIASFGVAVNRRYQVNNEWQEQTSFFDVACWAQLGETVAGSVHKGDRVIVFGRLEQRSWDTQEGEKRSKIEIVADEVGPSLRWATAEVARTERTKAGDAPAVGQTRGSGTTKAPSRQPADPPYGGEEPFVRPSTINDL